MKSILFIALLSLAQWVMAENMDQQSLQMCEKVKSCALAELDGQELPEEMRTMVMASMDGMCQAMDSSFKEDKINEYADLYKQAELCMESLMSLSCDSFMNGETETAACTDLEKETAKYE